MIWVIFGALAIFLIAFMVLEHHTKKLKIVLLLFLLFFLFLSVNSWLNNSELDFSSPSGVYKTTYSYVVWLGHYTKEMFVLGKDTFSSVGNVINGNETKTS